MIVFQSVMIFYSCTVGSNVASVQYIYLPGWNDDNNVTTAGVKTSSWESWIHIIWNISGKTQFRPFLAISGFPVKKSYFTKKDGAQNRH